MSKLEIIPIEGLPEISPGDDLIEIIGQDGQVSSGDILVITQKIISKAENQIVEVDPEDPLSHKPLVEEESVRILRRRGDLIISETKHGFVCANAGIDLSNVERGQAALLPEDSDRSARRIRDGLKGKFDLDVGVVELNQWLETTEEDLLVVTEATAIPEACERTEERRNK